MSIKRGVSLYSYQQAQFFKQMDWKDMIREVHDNLHTDGIEIIDESIIHGYPFPSEQFYFDWNNYMARYGMKAVTMDIYWDVHQMRDHVMTYGEGTERLKNDIKIAARMGFQNVRCLCCIPIQVIEAAIPTAEKYDVRIGQEIHAPFSIKPGVKNNTPEGWEPYMVDKMIDMIQRTGTKHAGLVPDMGIFQYRPTDLGVAYIKRQHNPDMVDFIIEKADEGCTHEEIMAMTSEKYPEDKYGEGMINRLTKMEPSAQPEDLTDIIPYIVSIHGKFYHMTEIPGKPGEYEDCAINYEDPIRYLKEGGYEGYIDSEFEGQRYCQDGDEYLIDEVDQVRKHQEMLTRLIGE